MTTPAPTPTTAYMLSTWGAVVEECDRLRRILGMIAESVIVKVVTVGGQQDVTWGCGICQGEYRKYSGNEWYDHHDWCPRK